MDIKIKKNQSFNLKGVYKFTRASLETQEQWNLHDEIAQRQKDGKEYMPLVRTLNSICRTRIWNFENIIPTVGRTMIADNLTNSSPDVVMRINFTAIGTGDTAVANGDTTLVAETFRKTTSSATNADNVAFITAFYTATETSGTFKEHALFSAGTASADSGTLFSRVLLNPTSGIVKSNTETLTIDYTITIS